MENFFSKLSSTERIDFTQRGLKRYESLLGLFKERFSMKEYNFGDIGENIFQDYAYQIWDNVDGSYMAL